VLVERSVIVFFDILQELCRRRCRRPLSVAPPMKAWTLSLFLTSPNNAITRSCDKPPKNDNASDSILAIISRLSLFAYSGIFVCIVFSVLKKIKL
jgi:hypothetical protein